MRKTIRARDRFVFAADAKYESEILNSINAEIPEQFNVYGTKNAGCSC